LNNAELKKQAHTGLKLSYKMSTNTKAHQRMSTKSGSTPGISRLMHISVQLSFDPDKVTGIFPASLQIKWNCTIRTGWPKSRQSLWQPFVLQAHSSKCARNAKFFLITTKQN